MKPALHIALEGKERRKEEGRGGAIDLKTHYPLPRQSAETEEREKGGGEETEKGCTASIPRKGYLILMMDASTAGTIRLYAAAASCHPAVTCRNWCVNREKKKKKKKGGGEGKYGRQRCADWDFFPYEL